MQITELIKAFINHHPDINENELSELVNVDPTTIQNERGVFCGKYAVWIANQYAKGNIKAGDAPELKAALTTYDKNKSQLKPIKEVMDLTELIEMVKDLSDDFKPARCISKGEQGLEKVYEDEEWIVYIPHTFEASRKIGGDTHWCTAASNGQRKFDYYTNKGPLYVNIRKSDGEKFQFHFETNSFMDMGDNKVKIKEIGFNGGIIEFYQNIYSQFNLFLRYDSVEYVKESLYKVSLNRKFNFARRTDGVLLSPTQWFDYCSFFSCGYAVIGLNQKYNWIDINGQILTPGQWFDSASNFNEDNAVIEKNGKQTWINNKGEFLLPNHWFDGIRPFGNGIAEVCLNGKWNFIKINGELLSQNQWFDNCISGFTTGGYGYVTIKGKTNRVDRNGKFLFDEWIDDYPILNDNDYNVNGICVGYLDRELVAFKNGKPYKIKELIDNYENR